MQQHPHHLAYQQPVIQHQQQQQPPHQQSHLPTEGYETWSHNQYEFVSYESGHHVYQSYEYPQVSAPPATPYMYPSAVQYQQPQHYEYVVQPTTAGYCDQYIQAPYYTTSTCPQTPPQVDYTFVHDGSVRAVRPQISVQTPAGPYAGPYTPVSSNPSSGSNSPQMVHCDTSQATSRPAFPSRYDYVNGSESLISPITPTMVPTAPNLLLAQPRLHYPNVQHQHHHHQDAAPHVVEHCPSSPIRPSVDVSCAPIMVTSYTPPSPISPVIDNTARSEQFLPSSVDPSSTISSPIEPQTPQIAQIQGTVPILKVSTKNNTSSLASLTPEERIQKLRDRRHVVACLFCRGRKIACHPEPTEESAAGPSRSASPDGYPRSAPEKRAPCGNCLRRGRECIYPERTPRTSRRRRAREQATAANAVAIAASLQEVRENARAESQAQPRIRVQIPQQHHILPRPIAATYAH
ncbi:hypothetical protein CPB86DRAFT_431436 [Serendipita vermifera]|nr:hypothetical protein CPB86DRAFT_431436 [Serendipita vermifera]